MRPQMKPPLPICTLSALAACTLSGQGGTQVYGEIKARDLCVTAPILLSAFCLACSR
nr:putative lipoprotein [Neisseria meningitidis alpha153]